MADDKLRNELINQFNKDFPDSPLLEMEDNPLAEIPGWITTGNYALNWVISKSIFRGLPLGRVVLFSGDAGSGKSMVALSMMREPSIDYIIYLDSEGGGVTTGFAKFLGLDTSKILYSEIDTVEDLIARMGKVVDILEKNKTNKKVLMVVDSVSMLSTDREKDPNKGEDMGNKAKTTRKFFRQYIRKMQKLNICCVLTAHLTENIGGYGPAKTTSGGGTILKFAPTIEVRFNRVNADSDVEKTARGAKTIAIRAEIEKSRLGTYGKRVKFILDMERGLDSYAGLFDILRDYEFIIPAASDFEKQIEEQSVPKRSSGWWCFKPWDEFAGKVQKLIVEKELTTSGKFRESQISEWATANPWFMEEIQTMLESIDHEEENEKEESNGNEVQKDVLLTEEKKVEYESLDVEVKETEKKSTRGRKKSPKVEIKEIE